MSLGYRLERQLRRLLEGRERAKLHERFGIPKGCRLSVDFLRAATVIKSYNPPIRRLIDIGANQGQFTATMSRIWDFSEILCVEPNEELREPIRSVAPSFAQIVAAAIGKEEGYARFYIHPSPAMSSLLPVDPTEFKEQFGFYDPSDITEREISVRTLDSLVEFLTDKSSRDILLKIDTQGAELDVLASGQSILRLSSACLIEYMFWSGYKKQYELIDLLTVMAGNGFRCTAMMDPKYRRDGGAAFADLLFLPVCRHEYNGSFSAGGAGDVQRSLAHAAE